MTIDTLATYIKLGILSPERIADAVRNVAIDCAKAVLAESERRDRLASARNVDDQPDLSM